MKTLKTCVAMAMVLAVAGLAAAQTIDDIQYYDPATGAPASPYDGQTVTVNGTVYVVAGTYNSGTHYIQGATGGIQFFASGTGLTIGDQVEVTGTVSAFSGELQIASPSITTTGHTVEPTPVQTTPSGILQSAEPYEFIGSFAAVVGEIATKSASQFTIMDEGGGTDSLIVYIDSDTGINIDDVAVGDIYMVKTPVTNFNGLIELKPRQQSDLVENPGGDTVPVIQGVNLDNWVPLSSTPIAVSAQITDNSAVASASVYYRNNNTDGNTPSAWMNAAMTHGAGDTWSGTIPAPHSLDRIDFYLSATDDGNQTVYNPGSAPTTFRQCAIGLKTIYQLQYVNPDSSSQDSPYLNKVINVKGVVTAGTNDVGAPSKFVIEAQDPGPYGGYRYGGVLVYEGTAQYEYYRGDVVEVGGFVDEYNFLTELQPHNGSAVNLVGFGAELPPAERAHTRVLADDVLTDGNGRLAEAYEMVWVKTYASVVLDTLGFGSYIISDTGARPDSCVVEPYVDLTYQPTLGDVIYAEGFMNYQFGEPQIVPISDEFITLTGWVGVEDDTPTVLPAGGFKSVYPNPFNPMAKISFVLNRDNLTQLNIYNIRGELVRSLVNEPLRMGDYTFTWDGTDVNGHAMASGQYFARLRIGKTVYQVRKLSLVK